MNALLLMISMMGRYDIIAMHQGRVFFSVSLLEGTQNSLLFFPQVWALAVGMKTEMVATGGTDSVLNLWHDCTMEDKQEDFRKKASESFCYTFSIIYTPSIPKRMQF